MTQFCAIRNDLWRWSCDGLQWSGHFERHSIIQCNVAVTLWWRCCGVEWNLINAKKMCCTASTKSTEVIHSYSGARKFVNPLYFLDFCVNRTQKRPKSRRRDFVKCWFALHWSSHPLYKQTVVCALFWCTDTIHSITLRFSLYTVPDSRNGSVHPRHSFCTYTSPLFLEMCLIYFRLFAIKQDRCQPRHYPSSLVLLLQSKWSQHEHGAAWFLPRLDSCPNRPPFISACCSNNLM